MDLLFDPVKPLLEIYPKNPNTLIQKNISTLMFTAALFTITKIWKQLTCPSINEWIKQLGHLHNGILLGHKKKKVLPFATTWMDLENIMLGEISQSEKDKDHMFSLTCGI